MTTLLAADRAVCDDAYLVGIARVATVAGEYAADVDAAGRFPAEALAALRAEGALGALVPQELGGPGVSFPAVAQACALLGRRCSATAMVYAMHCIQVSSLVRHAAPVPFFRGYLLALVTEQRLVASVTSEIGIGGDMGRSAASLEPLPGQQYRFTKQAPTISYGAYADDLLTTLRRDPGAEPGDQVLVLSRREQTELAPTGSWDPLGMRGTCSPGFTVSAQVPAEQVLAAPFSLISAATMVPVSHLLWAHLWLGIATEAFDRARAFSRACARRSPGGPTGPRLSQLHAELSGLRAEVAEVLQAFTVESADGAVPTMASALRYNTLKITASEAAPRICLAALAICGFAGYRNDSPYSVGRQLRDTLSAAVMVSNDRLHETNAALLLVVKDR